MNLACQLFVLALCCCISHVASMSKQLVNELFCDFHTKWGACSVTCGSGMQFGRADVEHIPAAARSFMTCPGEQRRRVCRAPLKCPVVPVDKDCTYVKTHLPCSASCGYGYRTTKMTILRPAKGNGKPCPKDRLDRCYAGPCSTTTPTSVDQYCLYTEKSTACSATCGNGFKTILISITRPAKGNGKACPSHTVRFERCEDKPCPATTTTPYPTTAAASVSPLDLDCQYRLKMDECMAFSGMCGAGVQINTVTVLRDPIDAGQPCPPRKFPTLCYIHCPVTAATTLLPDATTTTASQDATTEATTLEVATTMGSVEVTSEETSTATEEMFESTGVDTTTEAMTTATLESMSSPAIDVTTEVPECAISYWTAWSNCMGTCEKGLQLRNRITFETTPPVLCAADSKACVPDCGSTNGTDPAGDTTGNCTNNIPSKACELLFPTMKACMIGVSAPFADKLCPLHCNMCPPEEDDAIDQLIECRDALAAGITDASQPAVNTALSGKCRDPMGGASLRGVVAACNNMFGTDAMKSRMCCTISINQSITEIQDGTADPSSSFSDMC